MQYARPFAHASGARVKGPTPTAPDARAPENEAHAHACCGTKRLNNTMKSAQPLNTTQRESGF
eukprot:10044416-Lingulodinium_polyedra.AAC.1